jgi:preprotein translocase subunit SecE
VAEPKPKKRRLRPAETVRERTEKAAKPAKPRRISRTTGKVAKPLKAASNFGRREYYLPLPENKAGRFLNKRRHIMPSYFRNSWRELRLVTWPSRRETWKLALAVFMFAIIFGVIIAITDYGLDKIFRKVLLKI